MNFISEKDVEEAKKKREEEWKKAREEGREIPEEDPEEFRDTRPLYEKLKEQKDLKQEAFEEKLKFKNMIYKGLNEDDAHFLSDVAQKQAQMDGRRFELESEEIAEFRAAAETLQSKEVVAENLSEKEETKQGPKVPSSYTDKKKSQSSILASAIIRKRKTPSSGVTECSGESDDSKNIPEKQQRVSITDCEVVIPTKSPDKDTTSDTETNGNAGNNPSSLSLLADYPSSGSDDENDNDD